MIMLGRNRGKLSRITKTLPDYTDTGGPKKGEPPPTKGTFGTYTRAKPLTHIEFWNDNGGGDPPDPDQIEKDISGCNLAFNIGLAKAGKKVADALNGREEGDLSDREKAQIAREYTQDMNNLHADYRKCLLTGKSLDDAVSSELSKMARESIEEQINAMSQSIMQKASRE